MNRLNKIVMAAAIGFLGISAVSVGFASWTYSNGDPSSVEQTVAAAIGDWHYLIEDGMFYKMIDDHTVDWRTQVTPATYNATGSSTSNYHVTKVENPSGTDVCVYYPYHGTLDGTTTVVTVTGVNGVTSYYNYISPFQNVANVKQIYLPTFYTSIGDGAFFESTSVVELHFFDAKKNGYPASSALTLGESSFLDCTALEYAELPANVSSIDSYAFGLSDSSTTSSSLTIHYDGDVYAWMNSVTKTGYVDGGRNGETTMSWHQGRAVTVECTDAIVTYPGTTGTTAARHSVAYKDTATTVAASTFTDDADLTAVTFGSSITSIGSSAFEQATGLSTLTFKPITAYFTIGTDAFLDCKGLTSVSIPTTAKRIDSYAFGLYNKTTNKTLNIAYAGSSSQWSGIVSSYYAQGRNSQKVVVTYNATI